MMPDLSSSTMLHADESYLVMGLGLTGYSVARYLLQHGYSCQVIDDREHPPYRKQLQQQYPGVQIHVGRLQDVSEESFSCVVVSPGLSVRQQDIVNAARSGKRIIGDIELFAEAVDKPVLAVTGSNGKSTVVDLLGTMIKTAGHSVAVGGNFGVPALDLLAIQAEYYVLELSSFQLETTHSLVPQAATVLNVSEDHMDRYSDLEDYRQTKLGIYHKAKCCISNRDDAQTVYAEDDLTFSLQDQQSDFSLQAGRFLSVRGEPWLDVAELKLTGRHNWSNCLAAMALASTIELPKSAILTGLRRYPGLPHRMQWVGEQRGAVWINDSKATNPGAMLAAISGLSQPVILLAGGQGKGADMEAAAKELGQRVKLAIVFGEDAAILQQSWQDSVAVQRVADLQQAVQRAAEQVAMGDVVLLSPACASFDQYSGFAARGEHFQHLVQELA